MNTAVECKKISDVIIVPNDTENNINPNVFILGMNNIIGIDEKNTIVDITSKKNNIISITVIVFSYSYSFIRLIV